jgi:hypothetical protein
MYRTVSLSISGIPLANSQHNLTYTYCCVYSANDVIIRQAKKFLKDFFPLWYYLTQISFHVVNHDETLLLEIFSYNHVRKIKCCSDVTVHG